MRLVVPRLGELADEAEHARGARVLLVVGEERLTGLEGGNRLLVATGPAARAAAVEAFLERIGKAPASRQPSAGVGEDVRLRGERVVGSGLELAGELVQLSAFTSRDGGRRAFGRIARPSRRV